MKAARKATIFIICVFSINLCKDVISTRIENSKKGVGRNYVQIKRHNMRKERNNSRENLVSECNSSESCEESGTKIKTELRNCDSNSHEDGENGLPEAGNQDNAQNTHSEMEYDKIIPCNNLYEVRNTKRSESTKKSTRKLITLNNSTIEASDQTYQGHISSKESIEKGKNAQDDFPYTVSILRKGAHYASGALVGERWVLSTAEEFYNVRETLKLFRIRLGSTNCKKGGLVTPIKRINIHPDFTPRNPSFDISVLEVAQQIPMFVSVKPIGISRVAGKVISGKFLITYWPRIVVKQGVVPPTAMERVKYNVMRVSTQTLVSSEECGRQFAAVNVTLDKSSLCLKPVKLHHSVCMPDVGAPVVSVDGLWGITSGWVSPNCPFSPLPTVFTRVSSMAFRNWIDAQMID